VAGFFDDSVTFARSSKKKALQSLRTLTGCMVNAHHRNRSNLFLDQPSALDHLNGRSRTDQKMIDFRKLNDCCEPGAWLMLSLQANEIPDPETVIVITFCHYANVVVGPEKPAN
jgi:hypothetical protein